MNKQIELTLVDTVGSGYCVSSEDGQMVHDSIVKALKQGDSVRLFFKNVEDLTSAFLNAAIGQLYGEFSESEIKAKLSVADAAPDDLMLLKRVVERAKEFFKDPHRFQAATTEALGEPSGH